MKNISKKLNSKEEKYSPRHLILKLLKDQDKKKFQNQQEKNNISGKPNKVESWIFTRTKVARRHVDNIIKVLMEIKNKITFHEFPVSLSRKVTINIIAPRFYYWLLVGYKVSIATIHTLSLSSIFVMPIGEIYYWLHFLWGNKILFSFAFADTYSSYGHFFIAFLQKRPRIILNSGTIIIKSNSLMVKTQCQNQTCFLWCKSFTLSQSPGKIHIRLYLAWSLNCMQKPGQALSRLRGNIACLERKMLHDLLLGFFGYCKIGTWSYWNLRHRHLLFFFHSFPFLHRKTAVNIYLFLRRTPGF